MRKTARRRPEDFPSAQHQPPSAASHSAGTGRKQSKCRHQRALLAPRDATRELRRRHHGISILPLWGIHAGGFPEHHSVKLRHLQKIPWDWETAVCCLPASSPAGFPKCLGFCMVSPGSPRLSYWAGDWWGIWQEVGWRSPQASRWSENIEVPSHHQPSSYLAKQLGTSALLF